MKRHSRIAAFAAASAAFVALGYLAGRGRRSPRPIPGATESRRAAPVRRILYWYDPMKPEVHFDHPGKSPFMDMELLPKYGEEGSETPGPVADHAPVNMPPGRAQEIGVTTERAAIRPFSGTVAANGIVAEDESLRFDVNVKFAGYIRRLFVQRTGDRVARGEPLFTVYSPELVATERELLLALENERRLSGSGSPDAVRDAARLTMASRDRLRLWDIPESEIERITRTGRTRTDVSIVSPASGTVLVKNAVEGMAVSPGMTLYSIADLSRVWVLADLYAAELSGVRRGDAARVSFAFLPGSDFEGRVDFVYPTVNAETRTSRVRIVVKNASGEIRPGGFAAVAIRGAARSVLAVPRSAVVETGKRSIAFVETSPGRFEPRELSIGERTPDLVEIRSGIREGERVVTSANFLIDSESRIGAAGTAPPGSAGQPRSPVPAPPAPAGEEPR